MRVNEFQGQSQESDQPKLPPSAWSPISVHVHRQDDSQACVPVCIDLTTVKLKLTTQR